MTTQEQIDALREQIHVLEEQSRLQMKEKILPFLQAHGTLIWGGYSRMEVEFDSEESETKAIKLLEEVDGTGYHLGAEIAKDTHFRYDDGEITLSIHIGGKTEETIPKILDAAIALGMKKISFDQSLKEAHLELAKAKKKLVLVEKLQLQYLQSKAS
jgi:hypothetical protein